MKKVVISTFNNSKSNYGAVFQACALSAFLRKLGYDAYNVSVLERGKNKKLKLLLKIYAKKILTLRKKRLMKERVLKFRRFVSQTQKQITFQNIDELYKNPPEANVYISGSDQVWNPTHIHEDFFLSYVSGGAKKISYAASMGNEKIPPQNEERFAGYISEFDAVSVREDTMIDIISKYTDKPVKQNIDPVFLLSKEEWLELATPYERLKFKDYILVYAISWNAEYNNKLKELKRRLGLPAVSVCIGNMKKISADQVIYNASPSEFLHLLNGASAVVATSFHGTALSIVFNKPFMSFSGKDKPTRIESLLRHFGIENDFSVESINEKVDYCKVNEIISQDKEISREYLTGAIG